jgi:NAD(P)-binding Rossmann-like domain
MSPLPRVTVVGGGLAGITAALRLAQRGYGVTLYEQKSMLGGNLASRPVGDGVEVDIYPHMYLSWYHNFWGLLGDVTRVNRDEHFERLSSVKQLRRGEFPRFRGIDNMYSPWFMLRNLFSGVGPPADMYVFGYSVVDLLAEKLNPTVLLDDVSVTGFLHGRPYITERAADACDSFITMVWAIPSYLASAEDYRRYLAYSLAEHSPAYRLAKDSAFRQVIGPLEDAMRDAGVDVVRSVRVTSVSRTEERVTEIGLERTRLDRQSSTWRSAGQARTEPVEELVLAVPPDVLSSLVRGGEPGHRIVERAPELAEVSRLRTQRIPILNLYFTRRLQSIPREPVGLFGSRYALAFTDISQTWQERTTDFGDRTVLSLSASDPYGLPGTGGNDDPFAMLVELRRYVPFELGSRWGESGDIDWERTHFEPNTDAQLSLNETGADAYRPKAQCDGIVNLSIAGDYCENDIGMMTIESAVTTGLHAARAIVARHGGGPVAIVRPEEWMRALFVWLRYAWAPYAAAAKAMSMGSDCLAALRGRRPGR